MTGTISDLANPFRFGVVADNSAFCDRKNEIKFLKSQIRNGYSTWMFAPRRFGKTSLIGKVIGELPDIHCIYLNLYDISSTDEFCRKYAGAVTRQLFNWKDVGRKLTRELAEVFPGLGPVVSFDESGPSFSMNIPHISEQKEVETILHIPELMAARTNQRICVAFDEFQEIQRAGKSLVRWMSSSFRRHSHLAYIFLGSSQPLMESLFDGSHSPFRGFAVKTDLPVIRRKKLHRFIRNKFRDHEIPVEEETIEEILEASQGHPHLTQYFASIVFDLIKSGADQHTEGFTGVWLQKAIRSQADTFQGIFDQLTGSQRATLRAVAGQAGEGIFSEAARRRFGLPVSSSLNVALTALQKKGLVHRAGNRYRMSSPLFRLWILDPGQSPITPIPSSGQIPFDAFFMNAK